ncbi:general secretion pathway protein GspK [Salinisphaera sp. Q1T1-3]|nr:general secretion pathway protein GspK [Salinisphaera sp. Q1T1-3]
MLIMALTAIITTRMIADMNLALQRSGNIWNAQQDWWYGIGIENWLGAKLREDALHTEIDSLNEQWAQPVDYLPIDGGSISGRIIDLQGRFNLNDLVLGDAEATMAYFKRLIVTVTDTDPVTAQTIAQSTRDWIDSDIQATRPYGAEDNYYLGLDPAYRTGNTLMTSPSELSAVRGVTPAIYRALLPYIATLPTQTAINVNTAPAPVLQALTENMPQNAGADLVDERAKRPWKTVDEFDQAGPMAGQQPEGINLDIRTHYFLVAGRITVGNSQTRFYSVLNRADNGAVHVVRHATDAY